MPARNPQAPSYRRHKASGQAVVTLNGRDVYLGPHGTQTSRDAYDRVIGEWLANGRRAVASDGITVVELVVAYLKHVDGRYKSNEPGNIRAALKPVRQVYGATPAAEFGPLALKATRQRYIEAGNCRTQANKRTRNVVRMFRWGVSEQLVSQSVWEALRSVEGLRKGEAGTRESDPVRPVHPAHVEATLEHTSRTIAAMVRLQLLTGARPGEICQMRTIDLNTAGAIWEYVPGSHKTEHHGKSRTIFIGPAAQEVLRPWLRPELQAFVFSPREATAERMADLRAARASKVQPSQVDRSKRKPRKQPGERYTAGSYRQAITRAVARANAARVEADPDAALIPEWHPHQLRHTAATMLRREVGLDVARAVLGHTSPAVTEIYAEADRAKARDAMGRFG